MSRPEVMHTIVAFRAWRAANDGALAFVPTMGALHEGHASLVRAARGMADGEKGNVAASIFVNPTQFGPAEDFMKYPHTLDSDLALLRDAGCDVVFVPTAAEMYGEGASSKEQEARSLTVDPGVLGTILEGAIRPGHFRGVCTVVLKLLNIVTPTKLVMGQKDYQQNVVLRAMIQDLNVGTEHVMCETLREKDGLAMSSRNRYLSAEERGRAVALFEALSWGTERFAAGEREGGMLAKGMRERIEKRGLRVEYALAADRDTLAEFVGKIAGGCVLLVAARLGSTRLIDNMIVG